MRFPISSSVLTAALFGAAGLLAAVSAPAQTAPATGTHTMPCSMLAANCARGARHMGQGVQGMMGEGGMQQGMMGQGKPSAAAGAGVVYGSQLMTPEERAAYRAKLRAAKTPEERIKIRAEHHQEMQQRAEKAGVTLPPLPGWCANLPPDPAGETVYGSRLMTAAECNAYRAKLRAAGTPEERAKIRAAHIKEIQERAKKAGMTLAPPPHSG